MLVRLTDITSREPFALNTNEIKKIKALVVNNTYEGSQIIVKNGVYLVKESLNEILGQQYGPL